MAQCNKCNTKDPNLIYYWNGDIEEDYTMPNNYQCLCEICFDILNVEKKIKWRN